MTRCDVVRRSRVRGSTPLRWLGAPLALVAALSATETKATSGDGQTQQPDGSVAEYNEPTAPVPNAIDGLTIDERDDGATTLRIKGRSAANFNVYRISDPDRLVIDIAASSRGTVVPRLALDTWACGRVSIDDVVEQDAKFVRVVVELKQAASYVVVPDGAALVVTVTPHRVPPDTYFSRRSAQQRRADLEAQQRFLGERARRTAEQGREVQLRASLADKAMAEARGRVEAAKGAEARALAAEQRARAVELSAARALEDGRSHRARARRLLRQAQSEREKAEQERVLAAKARKDTELALMAAKQEAAAKLEEANTARNRASQRENLAAETLAQAEREASATLRRAAVQAEETARKQQLTTASLAAADQARATATRAKLAAEQAQAEAEAAKHQAERIRNEAEVAKRQAEQATSAKLAEAEQMRAIAMQAQAQAERSRVAAQHAQNEADAARKEAQRQADLARKEAARVQGEAQLAKVQAEREVQEMIDGARRQLEQARADAQQIVDDARRDADVATKARLHEAEIAAAARVASAEREARTVAAAKLSEAESAARDKLTTAREAARIKAASEVAAARRKAVAEAEAELEKLAFRARSQRDALIATARADAEKAAAKELARARRVAQTAAEQHIADAQERARRLEAAAAGKVAQAQARLAEAEAARRDSVVDRADAARAKAEALALREQARTAIERAQVVVDQAEQEKRHAQAERQQAEQALKDAQKEAAAARERGQTSATLLARVEAAERTRDEARERQRAADRSLARLAADRANLAAKLKAQHEVSAQLRRGIERKEAELAERRDAVAAAQAKLAEQGPMVEAEQLQEAQNQARQAQTAATVLKVQVQRLRDAAEDAERRSNEADKRLRVLQAAHERKSTIARAQREAKQAATAAAAAREDLKSSRERLSQVESQVRDRTAELTQLTARWEALRSQGRRLAAKNKAAQAELKTAERKLAAVERSLTSERERLAGVSAELRKAQETLERRVSAMAQAASEPGRLKSSSQPTAQEVATAQISNVRFEDDANESRVVIQYDGQLSYSDRFPTPTVSILALAGATLPTKLQRSLDASSYRGPVKLVSSFADGANTNVVVSTTAPTQGRVEQRPGELVWHFARNTVRPKSQPVTMAATKVGAYTTTTAAAPAGTAAVSRAGDGDSGQVGGRSKWRGERINIEMQDAPIKDVLLLLGEIGRVNIIAGDKVDGRVTMRLNSIPWDQALDIILRSQGLGSVRDGNVVRVGTIAALEEERRTEIERAAARVQLKPLETRLLPVSYAGVQDMAPKVQNVLSSRGTVTPDSRTNTLIIMDVAENIALAEQLVRSLDTQTPQVLIEARIVEARTSFARQLGVQWGFDYTASPGTGNPTGLLFPNSLGIGGGATGRPADTRGMILPGAAANPNYAVDLPAPVGTGTGGAIGFSFGSISGNLNTNLRLSASESTGEIRIISAPKVVTLDNTEAQIEEGVQIPISQVSAQGVNTRFVRATLSLKVTPHVTNEGSVLLEVAVQKNEADFVNTGARGDPTILTKQAESRMLINDNDTAVIGGIYTRTKAVSFDKIPWIADVPIIGWFFKQKSEADTRSEVLIFLTPKIVNRASSIGG